jgi:transketolase
MFAAHHKLDNLIIVIDYNKIQSFGSTKDVLCLDPLKKKFTSFNWEVKEVNGHDINQLEKVFYNAKKIKSGKPHCIIAHTIKGKGVTFMENRLSWHYQSPDKNEYKKAKMQINKKDNAQ